MFKQCLLFILAGPVESVRRPRDPSGQAKSFGFILYKHECSVPYALEIFRGVKLFNRSLNINSRSTLRHEPVLDTHITEFTEPRSFTRDVDLNVQGNEAPRYQDRGNNRYVPYENHRRDSSNRQDSSNNRNSKKENEPTSWAEFNALRGKNLGFGNSRSDLQGNSEQLVGPSNGQQMIPDFNLLLQMSQQMLLPPGMMGLGGLPLPNSMPLMGGLNPSMQGGTGGIDRFSPERDRGRRDQVRDRRESRRGHQYDDRGRHDYRRDDNQHHDYRDDNRHHNYQDNNRRHDFRDDNRHRDDRRYYDDHQGHDRGYSSSRSSHDRERRDRRSR